MKKYFLFLVLAWGFLFCATAQAAGTDLVTLSVKNHLNLERQATPISWSVPIPKDKNITDVTRLKLSRNGQDIPAQFRATARWGGSPTDTTKPVMWVLIDTQLDLAPNENASVQLSLSGSAASASPLQISTNDAVQMVIETGAATFELSKTNFHFFDRVTLKDGTSYGGNGGIVYNGLLKNNPATITVEESGPERMTLRVHGTIESGFQYTARLHFYKNLAEVKVDFRVENLNPTPTNQFGQVQADKYGSAGSVNFDDLSIRIPAGPSNYYVLPKGELGIGGEEKGSYTSDLTLIQESSGDDNWDVMKNLAPRLQSGVEKRASTQKKDGIAKNGPNQIAGWLDGNGVTVGVLRAWQNFPKSFRLKNNMVEIGLFPGEYSRNFELRAGEFKTHTFWVRFHQNNASDIASRAQSFLSPVWFSPPVDYIARAAPGILLSPKLTDFSDYEKGLDAQINETDSLRSYFQNGGNTESGEGNIFESISKYGEYGIVDYGDIPTDFEAKFGPYNWKYDGLRGAVINALRNPNSTEWNELALAGCQHVADIDLHHSAVKGYTDKRSNFEGGFYGHTFHNEDGRLNPHRQAGPPETAMAGPDAGLLLCAILTGDSLLLDSGLENADNMYYRATHSNYDTDVNSQPLGGASIAKAVGLQQCEGFDCSGYEPLDGSRIGGNFIQGMHMAYVATGDKNYLDIISKFGNYMQRYETEKNFQSCDRFHFQTTFVKNLGAYLYFRNQLGLAEDTSSKNLLSRKMQYMTQTLWDPNKKIVRTCYESGNTFKEGYFENNWQLGAADSLAIASLVLNKPDILKNYAFPSFSFGSKNIAWEGSPAGYFATKEFVNQLGFGNIFEYAWFTTQNASVGDEDIGEENTGDCALPRDRAYKIRNTAAVYYVDLDCKKRPFANAFVYFTYFDSWADVHITSDTSLRSIPAHELGFMPLGPKYDPQYGALVKTVTDPKVYFLLNGKKYWITSEEIFTSLHYQWNWIEDIDPRLLDKYPSGGEINDRVHHLDGTIIQYPQSAKIYVLDGGKKRHIVDEKTFESLRYRWDRIVLLSTAEVYPDGEDKTLDIRIRLDAR